MIRDGDPVTWQPPGMMRLTGNVIKHTTDRSAYIVAEQDTGRHYTVVKADLTKEVG